MKNLFLSLLMISPVLGMAQPSDASIISLIRKNHQHAKTIKLGGSTTSKEFINGKWIHYYKKNYIATFKADELPDITMVFNGSVQYIVSGGSYSFNKFYIGTTEFDGVPNPNQEEVSAIINSNLQEFLRFEYNDIIGGISEITIPSGTKYNWTDLNHVEFETVVTYTKKVSNTKIEKATHTYETHLYRDDYNLPWKSFQAFDIEEKKQIISSKTVSESEMENYKTLAEINEIKQAENMLNSLPTVEEPAVFKSDKQIFYYMHHLLMTKNELEVKAHLYKLIDKSYFESENILNDRTNEWVENITTNLKGYQQTFCKYPKIKEEQEGMIYFYNKDNSKFVRIRATKNEDTWKLVLIEFYPPTQDIINKLSSMEGNCGEVPDLVVKEIITYNIGDKVNVTLRDGVYTGEILKKDSNFDNRFYVKTSDGRSYWINDDKLSHNDSKDDTSQSNTSSNTNNNSTNDSQSVTVPDALVFKVGDKVKVKTRSGNMRGKIIKSTNGKFLVKLSDPRYEDMWVAPSNLIKI